MCSREEKEEESENCSRLILTTEMAVNIFSFVCCFGGFVLFLIIIIFCKKSLKQASAISNATNVGFISKPVCVEQVLIPVAGPERCWM